MNWFRQNRFLGTLLIIFGVATLVAAWFLWSAKSRFDEAQARFDENAGELNRLQRLTPFPTEANLRKMKTQAEDYATGVKKLQEELKTRSLPVVPMQPNEFQARLRQAITAVTEKARANKVRLPENFFLGFDEYASALPDTAAAPLLGQELAQAEQLVGILIDARIDALTSFRRVPEVKPTPTPGVPPRKPPAGAAPAEQEVVRNAVEASFVSSPGAARRALNQVAGFKDQFYVIRTLHVLNEKDKGPSREEAAAAASAAPPATPGGTPAATSNTALTFIVGNERLQIAARIEMLRFSF